MKTLYRIVLLVAIFMASISISSFAQSSELAFTVNGVTFNMVRVKGGTFTMGATPELDQVDWPEEKPAHKVTVSDYYIAETEVTQRLWEAVTGYNPSYYAYCENKDFPVEEITWDQIVSDFLPKLNKLTGQNFILPTEAQWEYAARGGNKSKGFIYSGSNNVVEVAWCADNCETYEYSSSLHPVAEKKPNELGLYDMSGNVAEFCSDWYGLFSSKSLYNPKGPDSGISHVVRGGEAPADREASRVCFRCGVKTDSTSNFVGFRLAHSANLKSSSK